MSSDLKKGSKKVKFDGGNSAAIKGSEFSRCSGDEAGTAGGVKSSTNMKEATWILYSFDVKIEGKNACRLSDKMMMNHGNTACLSGEDGNPRLSGKPPDNEKDIKCAIHECDEKEYDVSEAKDDKCAALGKAKHTCVANHPKVKDKEPGIKSEAFCSVKPPKVLESGGKAIKNFYQAANTIGTLATYKKLSLRRPDLIYTDKNGGTIVADAKFPCPDDVKSGKKTSGQMVSKKNSEVSMLTGTQKDDYGEIQGNGDDPQEIQPSDCKAEDCD